VAATSRTTLSSTRSVVDTSAVSYSRALRGRLDAHAHLLGLLGGVDALAMPTTGIIAPVIDDEIVLKPAITYTFLANYAGFPAVTVPCGFVDGLPVGLHLIGRPGTESMLMALASFYEEHVGWTTSPDMTAGL